MNYYEILGIDKNASTNEIKRAYRKLVKQWHPDKNKSPEAEKKFKKIQKAYEILSDENKRKQYDMYGSVEDTTPTSPNGFNENFFDMSGWKDLGGMFSSFFESFGYGNLFGRSATRANTRKQYRPSDITANVDITLEEANEGVTKDIEISYQDTCPNCQGTGAQNAQFKTCPNCKGRGYIENAKRTLLGSMVIRKPCRICGGTGEIPSEKCATCNGTGYINRTQSLSIKIPPGSYNGMKIRYKLPNNYLYVNIFVKEHPVFKRNGNDLHTTIYVDAPSAVLGSKREIETLYGKITIKIPSGTQHGDQIRIRNYGMHLLNNKRKKGDLIVKVEVLIPRHITRKEKELWTKLQEISNDNK